MEGRLVMVRTVIQTRELEAQAEERIAFADGALGAAGHSVSDPVLREILRSVVAGEVTREQGSELARRHIESR